MNWVFIPVTVQTIDGPVTLYMFQRDWKDFVTNRNKEALNDRIVNLQGEQP